VKQRYPMNWGLEESKVISGDFDCIGTEGRLAECGFRDNDFSLMCGNAHGSVSAPVAVDCQSTPGESI
jgi:hypothetical protein